MRLNKNTGKIVEKTRLKKMTKLIQTTYFSENDLSKELSISIATVRNWIRLGKITPDLIKNHQHYFSKNNVDEVLKIINSNSNNLLKSRRNKKHISGFSLYKSYIDNSCKNFQKVEDLIYKIVQNNIDLKPSEIQYIIANYAINIILDKMNNKKYDLKTYLSNNLDLKAFNPLIDDLIDNKQKALTFINKYPFLFDTELKYINSQDTLGLIYISLSSLKNRKQNGEYYTPTNVVEKLISHLDIKKGTKIIDPCCGCGNFLINLPDDIALEQIYGWDINPVSVAITRLNLGIKYGIKTPSILYKNITVKNFLFDEINQNFDYIIGNPPWGYNFSDTEIQKIKKNFKINNKESFDLFIEKGITLLNKNGEISFVVPESILNVKTHKNIREFIINNCRFKYVEFLGEKFNNVQCPSIILKLLKTESNSPFEKIEVVNKNKKYYITTPRKFSQDKIDLISNDVEYKILNKLTNSDNNFTLKNQSIFALGIVTGDNKKYITSIKNDTNEPIIKGVNLKKYKILPETNYIKYEPKNFQQIAPENIYRADEKLFYKFISKTLVFSYDNKKRLSLNSCNILIPQVKDYNIKYILAILNSRIAQFIYQKKYNSIKVLRSHLEAIPIPKCPKSAQKEIIELVNDLIAGINFDKTYNILDQKIRNLYKISESEYNYIITSIEE